MGNDPRLIASARNLLTRNERHHDRGSRSGPSRGGESSTPIRSTAALTSDLQCQKCVRPQVEWTAQLIARIGRFRLY